MASVSPVVAAIVGKPLISGVPTASTFASVSLPAGTPEPNSTTVGTVTARMSGGWTIGANRLALRTPATAATEPMK